MSAPLATALAARRRVPPLALARCFVRSLFLQAAWNRRGMQNLGFAYAVEPALRALYPEPLRHREALARHLGFFNCHPYAAAGILGGAIHHEERVAAGEELAGAPVTYKATLQGPLAAVGDGFFWTALRPFSGALAALGALVLGWPAVLVTLVAYNAVHLTLRIGLFRAGYQRGDAIVTAIGRLALPALAGRLRLATAALCGLAAAALAARAAQGGRRRAPPRPRSRSWATWPSPAARRPFPPPTSPGRWERPRPSSSTSFTGRRCDAGDSFGAHGGPRPPSEILMPRLERSFLIVNILGLHARAAAQLVQAANRFRSEVHLEKDGSEVNGKSIMGVLTLAAAKGTEVLVACEGEDADAAMVAIAALIENGFGEK